MNADAKPAAEDLLHRGHMLRLAGRVSAYYLAPFVAVGVVTTLVPALRDLMPVEERAGDLAPDEIQARRRQAASDAARAGRQAAPSAIRLRQANGGGVRVTL